MKVKMYVLITAVLTGFAVWFIMHQKLQHVQSNLQTKKEQYVQAKIENKILTDSLAMLRPYHRARVDFATLAALTETKKPGEIRYVSTVIRNRVKMCYGGNCTFFRVVAEPYQFSGIWRRARSIVEEVILADQDQLPLPKTITHFYSPRSIRKKPMWANMQTEHQAKPISKNRFRFYESR